MVDVSPAMRGARPHVGRSRAHRFLDRLAAMRRSTLLVTMLVAACGTDGGDGPGSRDVGGDAAEVDAAVADVSADDARDVGSEAGGMIDLDFDGVDDAVDNCPGIFNPKQDDIDQDRIGDLCDPVNDDVDGDGIPNAADPFPADPMAPGVVNTLTVYAHTSTRLYYLDVKTAEVYLVGTFAFPNGTTSREMTDIAIDRHGVLYGISFDDVFVIDPHSARCWRLAALPAEFNGLTLIPREETGEAEDALVGIANDGAWWRLTLVPGLPGLGAQVSLTRYGGFDAGWLSSGDVFSIVGVGTFASVDTATVDRDHLVQVDPKSGSILASVGPIGSYDQVWGLAGWTGRAYGFEAGGKVLVLDLATGAIITEKDMNLAWWGAGVRTVIDRE